MKTNGDGKGGGVIERVGATAFVHCLPLNGKVRGAGGRGIEFSILFQLILRTTERESDVRYGTILGEKDR
jgi:hypothetical protein